MFAAFVSERDPLRAQDLPAGLMIWVQVAGGFAMFGLLLWLLLGLTRWRAADRARVPAWQTNLFLLFTALAGLSYIGCGMMALMPASTETGEPTLGTGARPGPLAMLLTVAGAFALLAVGLPFVRSLFDLRWRRIGALVKLSFKEAVRRRVLYAFTALLLVFLFASWFVPSAPKDQVRIYVGVVFWAMTALLLFTAVVLASFSIPADIKQQTIHTIVTKPVERFEIVLGRFLGFLALMTLVLAVMASVSLLYVFRGVNPEAAADSLKARVPIYGSLEYEHTPTKTQATNVGREWAYRSYITGSLQGEPQTARYDFRDLPAALAGRNQVRCEFTFDIYRTTKGLENRGVSCSFAFRTRNYREGNDLKFRKAREAARSSDPEEMSKLAQEYGYFETPAKEVQKLRTLSIELPQGLFQSALAAPAAAGTPRAQGGGASLPELTVRVRCTSLTQYVGMAKYDLYLRQDETAGTDRALFALNFYKATFGLWLRLALLIGLAVALSTYLSGVISMLVALLIYMGGLARGFIQQVALGTNEGGGPLEAFVRLTRRELVGPSSQDQGTVGAQVVARADELFRLVIRWLLHLIPDVERFDLKHYVAEGFNIPAMQLGLELLLLIGYLLPWAVLAYYLLKWREVAAPT
jgi:ABC-type transport system involved in multi-copper enzyme maturation permease subunit